MISVCMAVYNGEKYIKEQLDSILANLKEEDEIVVSDDGSGDRTREIMQEYVARDARIHLVEGPGKGVIRNFENALRHAGGDYLYLSDQDDIWAPGKVAAVQKCFAEQNCAVVLHDAQVIDEQKNVVMDSFFAYRGCRPGLLKNIMKNSYIGCCMAFRRELLPSVLPIPKNIAMHDQWIGLLGERRGGVCFLKKSLICYRRHGDNASSLQHFPVWRMFANRVVLGWKLVGRLMRRKSGNAKEGSVKGRG